MGELTFENNWPIITQRGLSLCFTQSSIIDSSEKLFWLKGLFLYDMSQIGIATEKRDTGCLFNKIIMGVLIRLPWLGYGYCCCWSVITVLLIINLWRSVIPFLPWVLVSLKLGPIFKTFPRTETFWSLCRRLLKTFCEKEKFFSF